MKLKVVVADDNPAVLRQLVLLLRTEFDVVSTPENGQSALECARRCQPDVVVLDLVMPFLNGIEVTRELRKLGPTCLWRIDTVGVKRSDPRSAQQPRTQAPDDLIGSLPKVDRIPERSRVFGKSENHAATGV